MKILQFEHGSPAWLAWREKNITATDAAIILNKNPFKTCGELFEEKLGIIPRQEINAAMQRGIDLEPIAREIACKEIGIEFSPACVQNDEHYWMVASLDGLSPCLEYVLEIKCPSEDTHTFSLNEGIKNYYMPQMQHQLAVTGAKLCYYMSYRPESTEKFKIIKVYRDELYIEEIIEKEHKFYEENLCQMKKPEELKYTIRNR